MSSDEIYDILTEIYEGYYNVEREGCLEPFDAVGYLSNEAQQYFLVKAAHIASVNSYEYVYFKKCDELDIELLDSLDKKAWEDGISGVRPSADHKNTDVALVIIADRVTDAVKSAVNTYKHSKNYKLGFFGFSNYRLVVIEAFSGLILTNRRGRDLRDFITHTLKKVGKGV
ncbi:MAG: hypothetical protein K6A71_06240 [Lachnospiraceae bacterium]|nr:hypothetical protein [Lachnospiraceae bacterium]